MKIVNKINLKDINDKHDKSLLKKFPNNIKIIQIDTKNYIYGFSNKNTFEIIRIKGNFIILPFLKDRFKKIIINIPIKDNDMEKIITETY